MAFLSKLTARMLQPKIGAAALIAYAFGKHPGWDDHMADVGIAHPDILTFKQQFYVEALAGNINSGAWKHLPEPELIPMFDHQFAALNDDTAMIGAMWASSDGKGRTLFPMIGLIFSRGLSPMHVAHIAGPIVETFQASAHEQKIAGGVQTALDAAQQQLNAALPSIPLMTRAVPMMTGLQTAALIEPIDDARRRARIVYCLQRVLEQTRSQTQRQSQNGSFFEHVRLPQTVESPQTPASRSRVPMTALSWAALLLAQLGTPLPVLSVTYTGRPGNSWNDLIIGAIKTASIFPLRASNEKIPPCSEIPFELSDKFVKACDEFLSACRKAGDQPAPLLPSP